MQNSVSIGSAASSSPLARQSISNARRSSRIGGAVSVRARAFEAAPKSDKFVPKRNPGAGDLRKLGSSDLMVSCKWIDFFEKGRGKGRRRRTEAKQIDVASLHNSFNPDQNEKKEGARRSSLRRCAGRKTDSSYDPSN